MTIGGRAGKNSGPAGNEVVWAPRWVASLNYKHEMSGTYASVRRTQWRIPGDLILCIKKKGD